MRVIRVAIKGSCPHDQVARVGAGNAYLDTKLIGLACFAFADAFDLWGVPGVELGLTGQRFLLAALLGNACCLVQTLLQCLACGSADGAGFALHLTGQPAKNGALAFDGPSHAFELLGVCVAASLVRKLLSFFGIGLL